MTQLIGRAIWLGFLLVLVGGCSKGLQPVRGKVHFPDGTPLDQGKVVLNAVDGVHGASSQPLSKDGTFTLGSYAPDDGVPPGKYTVAIVGAAEPPASEAEALGPPKYLIHERFMDPVKSGLTFEVKVGIDNFLDITVEKPAKK